MARTGPAAPDRLSDLPDNLLIRILSFVPSREAASTTALSRRWRRPLWLETGVVNFDHRSYITTTTTGGGVPLHQRVWNDSLRARQLYRSRGRDPKKLTIVMRDDTTHNDDYEEKDVEAVEEDVREVAEERTDVEELRVERLECTSPAHCTYKIGSSLPFTALRVLEITGYIIEPDARWRLTFPCLEAMRLRRCRTEIATLQDMISAAPRLADLRLEAVCFDDDQYEYCLRCPAATAIVIADLHAVVSNHHYRELYVQMDAPCVRSFRYIHVAPFVETRFCFKNPMPPDLEKVHLAVHSGSIHAMQIRRSFLMCTSLRHNIRFLKLTAYSMADLDDDLEYYFDNLEWLEIEELCGWCARNDGDAASALVSLLRRCRWMRELRLKFSWREYLEETTADPADLNAAMSDFTPCRALVNVGDEQQDCSCDGLKLHELCRGRNLYCLQNSLRKVVLEFDTEELTCFQVRLVKFFTKNAMALEEITVDGGKGYDSRHIDRKIARWTKRKRLEVLPPPVMTPPPPPLSEFPPLGRAPDPDPVPSSPCSQAPSSSIGRWRSVTLVDLYGEFAPGRHRCSLRFPRYFPPCRRPPPAASASHRRSATLPRHLCKTRVKR